jgi:hypothetical protein
MVDSNGTSNSMRKRGKKSYSQEVNYNKPKTFLFTGIKVMAPMVEHPTDPITRCLKMISSL